MSGRGGDCFLLLQKLGGGRNILEWPGMVYFGLFVCELKAGLLGAVETNFFLGSIFIIFVSYNMSGPRSSAGRIMKAEILRCSPFSAPPQHAGNY